MQKIFFPSGNVRIAGNLSLPKISFPPGVLILHGGGNSNKERFKDLQIRLGKNNIASLAIDFRGVGESTGTFPDGSLKNRLEDAENALSELKKYADAKNIALFGSSMGGYVASCLAGKSKGIRVVVLSAAAAYSPLAEDASLNEEFTTIIRTPNSWENSKSFDALEKFRGKALVVYGQYDGVIPQRVQQKYGKITMQKGEYVVVENASHNGIVAKNEKEEKIKQIFLQQICDFLTKTLHVSV